ncbi:MAG: 30S ribosomal protein S9 [DPANN group archaeon]|nr:30S ribosomal protein S9 [DPANN group archaeon]
MAKQTVVQTSGKKKTAVARLTLKPGVGDIKINGVPLQQLTPKAAQTIINEPIVIAKDILGEDFAKQIDVQINTNGGGTMGQSFAARTALGAALTEYSQNDDLKKTYNAYDRTLLHSDTRVKESKKFLRKGARAKPTKSYR